MSHPILILGAGLAGLSLARTLTTHRIPFRIFEASPQIRKQSYGITLLSWVYEPLVNKLQLAESEAELKKRTATDSPVGGCGVINNYVTDAHTGATLRPSHGNEMGGPRSYRCSRSKIGHLLMQGLNIEFGNKLVRVETTSSGVFVHFEDGRTAQGSLVVGADGVHSVVREGLLPGLAPAVLPAMAINGKMCMARSAFDIGIGKQMGNLQVIVGVADRTALTVSISECTARQVDISWTFTWQPGAADHYKTDRQSTSDAHEIPPAFFDRLARLGPLAEPFQSVFVPDNVQQTAKYNWLMRSVQVPSHELLKSADTGAAIIGDAAHAMPIVAGEGANHALLDGMQLGDALALSNSYSKGIRLFYEAQTRRWESAVSSSQRRFSDLHRPMGYWRSLPTA